jgi:hypothetical protein
MEIQINQRIDTVGDVYLCEPDGIVRINDTIQTNGKIVIIAKEIIIKPGKKLLTLDLTLVGKIRYGRISYSGTWEKKRGYSLLVWQYFDSLMVNKAGHLPAYLVQGRHISSNVANQITCR